MNEPLISGAVFKEREGEGQGEKKEQEEQKKQQEQQEQQEYISIEIRDESGRVKAGEKDTGLAVLAFEGIYEKGDKIAVRVPQSGCHYVIRVDDTMDEALVYMTRREWVYEIPFEEKKEAHNPKSFTGERHYLSCRMARDYEINGYRNLAKNVVDQHGEQGCFPHASANVETRGEAVFAARNAIDGVVCNRSHGAWPYGSWGINRRQDAEILLEFGRPVDFDRIVLWTRADFPHDSWWVQASLIFSDGSEAVIQMDKSRKPHEFFLEKRNITWIKLTRLIQAEDPSPFPALTQIEVYGWEHGER